MRALSVEPGRAHSMELVECETPLPAAGQLLARTLMVGICGTDHEIARGDYGWAPPRRERLVIGHESLAEVATAPTGSGFAAGDLVVGIVRRPDPVPCPSCAHGEWDMCSNGQYTERGIKSLDGFCAESFTIEPAYAVKLPSTLRRTGVLVEPASVVAKAWEHIARIGRRAYWYPRRVLVTGAGPVGLMAALMAVQHGFEVHVLDRVTGGVKPKLVRALGATYHSAAPSALKLEPDIVVECTGVPALILAAMAKTRPSGIVCLAGLSSGSHRVEMDSSLLGQTMVLQNDVVFGSVNANRRHYELAVDALARADQGWLEAVIARRVKLERWPEAFERRPDDVKTVIDFTL